MKNAQLTAHPFAQLTSTATEQVGGGILESEMKYITFGLYEDGTGPIYTTQAIGEEGGHDFTEMQ